MRQIHFDEDALAAIVRYVRKRGSTFQYERRVPTDIVRRPEPFERLFGASKLFRRSLKTKDPREMHLIAVQMHDEFEALVTQARGKPVIKAVRTGEVSMPLPLPSLREVTDADLDEIKDSVRALISRPYERTALFAESGGLNKDYLDHLRHELEDSAEAIREGLAERGREEPLDSSLDAPLVIARRIIAQEGYDAPCPASAPMAQI